VWAVLVSLWFKANVASRNSLSKARWSWNLEKTILTGTWAYVRTVAIDVFEVRKKLHREIESLWKDMVSSLPDKVQELCGTFPQVSLEDDPADPLCIYDRADNATVLERFHGALWIALSDLLISKTTKVTRYETANDFLLAMQRLRDRILSILLTLSGVTPRAKQIGEAKFRADPSKSTLHRNLRGALGMLFLGNFESKTRPGQESRSFHHIATQLVIPIHFMCGVVRVAEQRLFRRYNLSIPEFNSYIFVKPPHLSDRAHVPARYVYSGKEVNIAATSNPGVGQPAGFQRQMSIFIGKTQFPQVLKSKQ